ncbi:MAG: hypothetical protein ABH878_09005 [bacterium]
MKGYGKGVRKVLKTAYNVTTGNAEVKTKGGKLDFPFQAATTLKMSLQMHCFNDTLGCGEAFYMFT